MSFVVNVGGVSKWQFQSVGMFLVSYRYRGKKKQMNKQKTQTSISLIQAQDTETVSF